MSDSKAMDALRATNTIALTTHRKDGRTVTTPVNVVVADGHAYFRTFDTSGKAKRLRNFPQVEFTPTSYLGRKPTGPEMQGQARLLGEEEAARARRALRRSFPFLHGILVPASHRIQRVGTVHYELVPSDD